MDIVDDAPLACHIPNFEDCTIFRRTRGRARRPMVPGSRPRSEEKVTLVRLPLGPAVPPEAHFLGVVSAEFIAKKLTVRCTPRLQFPIHDRQMFSAKRAASRSVFHPDDFSHLLFLTPRSESPIPHAVVIPEASPNTVSKATHFPTKRPVRRISSAL
jgi:hypothetical protein